MTKFLMAMFFSLTAGAAYMTLYDVNVMEPSIEKHSVRQGSTHRGVRGGFGGGK